VLFRSGRQGPRLGRAALPQHLRTLRTKMQEGHSRPLAEVFSRVPPLRATSSAIYLCNLHANSRLFENKGLDIYSV